MGQLSNKRLVLVLLSQLLVLINGIKFTTIGFNNKLWIRDLLGDPSYLLDTTFLFPSLMSIGSYTISNNQSAANNQRDVESGQQPTIGGKLSVSDDQKTIGGHSRLKFWKKKKPINTGQTNVDLVKDVKITEHLMDVQEVCAQYRTHIDTGITDTEAAFRLQRDGPNAFTPPKQTPGWLLWLREMTGGFALLLWFASIASFVAYGLDHDDQSMYLGVVLALTVLLTGTFSYYQAASSNSVFKSFKNMTPPQTTVIRDGRRKQIPADQVVVGDLLYCRSGDRVPADIRIVKSESMKVDNSSLTGESDPLARSPDVGHQNALEARNLAFFSTNCVDGSGYGIAIATGDRTVMGDIARLVSGIKNEKTPIAKEIDRFVKIITVLAVGSGIIFFGISMAFGTGFFNSFIFMIGITVGNVPEGLLPALTVALTLTAKRMASKNCLVKHLEAVETLGSTSTICTDKTGTLTQNRMTVEHCWLGTSDIMKVEHNREQVAKQMMEIPKNWSAYSRCAILCSRSEFMADDLNPDIMKRSCSGDASETAILRFMESVEGPVMDYRARYPKQAEKPFSSTYKYQYSIHRRPPNEDMASAEAPYFLVMKGAPERIIKLCSQVIRPSDGQTVQMDSDFMDEFEETYRDLGSMGERVLALCDYEFPSRQFPAGYKWNVEEGEPFEMANFRFLGLIAMIDPPRPTVPDAVLKCRSAGIKVIMVTGDHPITAQAIAKSVNIMSNSHRNSTSISVPTIDKIVSKNNRSIVVPGDDLTELTDPELREILDGFSEIVFARTSPQQKLRIVENCQYLGQIVAVTGDGVNDSPALKKADIGIAMGITGSEVSKQAADMILLDDNFATIVVGVEEGRRIFDNMKKTVSYIIGGNATTLFPFIIYVVFGFPLAIGTITVLLICLGTDMVPAIAIAYEKAESDIMNMPPRNPKRDRLVTAKLLMRAYLMVGAICTACGFLGYFISLDYEGFTPSMLFMLRDKWDDKDIKLWRYGPNDDRNGKPLTETTYDQRQQLTAIAQSSYFMAVVVVQWMDVIVNKTRRLSLFSQGMGNWVLNGSIVFETALAVLFAYTPGLHTVLHMAPVIGQVWVFALPFFIYLFLFEELRKLIIRLFPQSFLGQELLA
ncbi:sodium/potassium-transporting ATPase subunit alpha-3-like [Oppia nitens]|uniref:sodium/potassium-transporting ATPase subunit alpha-3-like n=1 Tax=Oppia nitens TaxID=1686743 RepID=UPI0023DB2BE5|nr:sodium/potassium-transporting ATPase subunit alpha-3-like [Oppia nitens]